MCIRDSYIAIACLITLVSVLTLRETRGVSLHEIDAEDRRRLDAERGASS